MAKTGNQWLAVMKGRVTMEDPPNEKAVVTVRVENICEERSGEVLKDVSELVVSKFVC